MKLCPHFLHLTPLHRLIDTPAFPRAIPSTQRSTSTLPLFCASGITPELLQRYNRSTEHAAIISQPDHLGLERQVPGVRSQEPGEDQNYE
jgi:hypothetical protein